MATRDLACLTVVGSVVSARRETEPRGEMSQRTCGYCEKELPRKHYKSPSGGNYCTVDCFRMFTED